MALVVAMKSQGVTTNSRSRNALGCLTQPGSLTVRHGIDGPNRNRWFTVLNSMVMFHGYVSHNQMVNLHYPMVFLWFSYKTSIFLW